MPRHLLSDFSLPSYSPSSPHGSDPKPMCIINFRPSYIPVILYSRNSSSHCPPLLPSVFYPAFEIFSFEIFSPKGGRRPHRVRDNANFAFANQICISGVHFDSHFGNAYNVRSRSGESWFDYTHLKKILQEFASVHIIVILLKVTDRVSCLCRKLNMCGRVFN